MSMRNYIREDDFDCPQPTPEEQLRADGRRSLLGLIAVPAIVFVVMMLVLYSGKSHSAEYTRDGGTADWQCCADKACTTIISQHADPVRAEKACAKLTDADGKTRYTRSNAFRITSSSPPPVEPPTCPAKPADETRAGACPAGTTGSWTQTLTYSSAASPICWTAGAWTPSSPPTGACVATPAPLTAPTLTATVSPNTTNPSNSNVTLLWTATPGATGYEVERCNGTDCTNFAPLATATVLAYANTNLPGGLTLRYRVRGVDASRQGAYSDVQTIVTPTAPPPPPTGTALIRINSGGGAVGDYVADQHFIGGSTSSNCNRAVSGVYATRRFSGTGFEYRIPMPNARYLVRLMWQECWHTAAGQRVLNANVEGLAIAAVDPWRADGAPTTHERIVDLTDGTLNIALSAVTGDAMLNAIEVSTTTDQPPTVPPQPTFSTTLSWTPPTQNTDGSTLTNLAGFGIYYGTSPGALTRQISVNNAGLRSFVVDGLTAGTWYFSVAARASNGAESAQSNTASRVLP
jgi:hypothetical protein